MELKGICNKRDTELTFMCIYIYIYYYDTWVYVFFVSIFESTCTYLFTCLYIFIFTYIYIEIHTSTFQGLPLQTWENGELTPCNATIRGNFWKGPVIYVYIYIRYVYIYIRIYIYDIYMACMCVYIYICNFLYYTHISLFETPAALEPPCIFWNNYVFNNKTPESST